jgi:fructoselysine/glucoselysine PTS system EIIB component
MIKLVRVDHRLLHGQVAFSWTNTLGADSILIANDEVVNDEIYKTTLKLAKLQGVRLVIKNIQDSINSIESGITDKYKLFIVVSSIEDAYKLATSVKEIKSINLGGVKIKEGTRAISQTINVTPHEEDLIKQS